MSWRGTRGGGRLPAAGARGALALSLALLAAPGAARAQAPGGGAQPAKPGPAIDPQAIAALNAMGAYLRSQTSMRVVAEMTTDDVINTGQKVQVSGMVDLEVRQPDRMRATVVSDRKNEKLFYDGKTFTVYQPSLGYYASFAAPPTITQLMDVTEQRYGIDMPLADLFRWGTDKSRLGEIRAATKLGTSSVRGLKCDHYAFRQSDIDWEICIESGSRPLPLKQVITTSREPTQPQHTAVMTWTQPSAFDEKAFTFTPPAAAQRIEFDLAQGAQGGR